MLPGGIEALASVGAVVVPVTERPISLDEQIALGRAPLVRAAERTARLINLFEPRG